MKASLLLALRIPVSLLLTLIRPRAEFLFLLNLHLAGSDQPVVPRRQAIRGFIGVPLRPPTHRNNILQRHYDHLLVRAFFGTSYGPLLRAFLRPRFANSSSPKDLPVLENWAPEDHPPMDFLCSLGLLLRLLGIPILLCPLNLSTFGLERLPDSAGDLPTLRSGRGGLAQGREVAHELEILLPW